MCVPGVSTHKGAKGAVAAQSCAALSGGEAEVQLLT